MRLRRTLGVLAVALSILAACGSGAKARATTPDAAPAVLAFTTKTLAGAPFDGRSYAGKPVAFWFWAPW
jgi:hypothetical protein